jgi:hypothetical protein
LFSALLVSFLGCENTLRFSNEPLSVKPQPASVRIERYSYLWPVGQHNTRSFELVLGSPIPLSPTLKESVEKFVETKPFEQEREELFIPEGLEPIVIALAEPTRDPNAGLTSLGSIPLADDKAVFAMSRDGNRIALFSKSGLEIWDVKSGQRERLLKSKVEKLESLSFDCDGRYLFLANSTSVFRVDIEQDRIDCVYSDFSQPIVQMVAALNVNKLVIRSKKGELFVTDESLAKVRPLPGVVSSSEISISPAGDRLAFWSQGIPTEVALVGLELERQEFIKDGGFRGGNRLLACGAKSSQWICGRECLTSKNVMNRSSNRSQQTERRDLSWDPVQLIVTSAWPDADQRLLVASRKTLAGESELVLCDLDMRFLRTSFRKVLPRGAQSVVVDRNANYVACQVGNEIRLYSRRPYVAADLEDFFEETFFIDGTFANGRLDRLGEFVLKNDIWWHYGYSTHDAFTQLAMYIGKFWDNFESIQNPDEKSVAMVKNLNQWLEGQSDLALISSAFRRYHAAMKVLNRRYLDQLSPFERRQFDLHVEVLIQDIQPLLSKGAASSATNVLLLFHNMLTDFDPEKVGLILERSAIEHPGSFEPYLMVSKLLSPVIKGKKNDVSLFARAVRDLYGSELGDMLYLRICLVCGTFYESTWDRREAITAYRLRTDLLLSGLQSHATNAMISKSLFMGAFQLLAPADNSDDLYREIMHSYYDRYLFVPIERVGNQNFDGVIKVNTPRYQVLRYIALLNGEEPPIFLRP